MGAESYLIMEEDASDLMISIDEKSADVFEAKADQMQLEASRLVRKKAAEKGGSLTVKRNVEVKDCADLKALENKRDDVFQIFKIRQERSWSALNISRELFEDFTGVFGVFAPVWKCVSVFGEKLEEHECDFPGFRSQRTSKFLAEGSFECTYVLRRVERHGRKVTKEESPFSIRQTAVYHKMLRQQYPGVVNCVSEPRSKFLLISLSRSGEKQIDRLLDLAVSQQQKFPPFLIHSLLIADSVKGWMEYAAWIEKDLKTRSDRITFSKLGSMDEDFSFSVEDRQELKVIEDKVIDLQTIIATLSNNIKGVRKHCQSSCQVYCKQAQRGICACDAISEKFDSYLEEVQLCMKRANALRDMVFSSAQLLSDLLRYEDQRALKELTAQSQMENRTMLSLAEKSTKDAEAMKVLTIIGLVYLPTTFVANFFSTEFVKADDDGEIQIGPQTWLLAVIALPLTMLTIVTWWLCVRCRTASLPSKLGQGLIYLFKLPLIATRRLRNRSRMRDIEDKEGPQKTFVGVAPRRTWSTKASTLLPE